MACGTIIVTEYIVGSLLATPRGKPQWLGYLCAYMVMGEVAGLGTMPGGSNIFPWTAGFSVNCGSSWAESRRLGVDVTSLKVSGELVIRLFC